MPVPEPFDLAQFQAEISHARGRPLHLHQVAPNPGAGAPCGMWLATAEADHIFYVPGSSELHRQNIILHEIGHMLWEHELAGNTNAVAALLPDLDPAMVARALLRTSYSTPQEQEAEMMAAVVLERSGWSTAEPRASGVLARLQEVFEPRRRRRNGI